MILWRVFVLMFVAESIGAEKTKIESFVTGLANKLSKSFREVKTFLNSDDLASKIKTKPKSVNEEEAINLLRQSKKATETLVTKTSAVVDKIQTEVTNEYDKFAQSGPVAYNIDCGLNNYMFYFRSKAIRNGSYELNNCTWQHLIFNNDSMLGNIKTTRKNSTVHIPTNVFDSSKEIQNVANYTENIDQTFVLSENKSYIKWQFFCSHTGFFKIYPGIRWHIQIEDMEKDNTKVDFYDCRSEQWFLESTAYPKKMVILVDKSGSMKGRRRIIANHTIYEILNTITENDFFNVILFAKEAQFADNGTGGILMQATEKNKKYVMDQLDIHFTPDGIAEYDIGLKTSLNLLHKDKINENSSTIYNYLIMIITDGSPQAYQETIDEGNKLVQARIFTYLIGQASTEREMVKHMACRNKGYAVEIATLADVKENVQKYLNVVARPNALMGNSFHVWTGVHQYQMRPSQDTTAYMPILTQPQLGLSTMLYTTNITQMVTVPSVTTTMAYSNSTPAPTTVPPKIEISKPETIQMFVTVSKAAYDISNETAQKKNGVLLGAVGVDVPISDFIKTAPYWKIGANSYLFGVTHNGFVIFHPRFRPQDKKHIKYFYRNVDISELEVAIDEIITEIYPNQTIPSSLRDKIIKITPSDDPKLLESRSTYDIVDDYKTAFSVSRSYFVTGIKGTSYKFGLAVPEGETVQEYLAPKLFSEMTLSVFPIDTKSNDSETCNVTKVLANEGGVSLKEYEFCHLNKELAALLLTGPLCLLREVLTNEDLRKACLQVPDEPSNSDELLDTYIRSVYSEAEDTQHLQSEWGSQSKISAASNVGAQQIFSMHHFGLIRYYNYNNLSYEQFIPDHSAGSGDPLYKETLLTAQTLTKPSVLVVRPLPNNVVKKNTVESLLVFTATTPIGNGPTAQGYKGIVGAQLNHQFYSKSLMDSLCISGDCLTCSNVSIFDCYVITGSGMIVLNNINTGNTGELLKEIDCKLMESLVTSGIFKSQSLYDFQALCANIPKIDSFASTLIDPFTKMFKLSIWLIYELFIIVQNFSFSSLFWSFSFGQDTDIYSDIPKPSPIDNNEIPIATYSSEAPLKQTSNLFTGKDQEELPSPVTKSKRQHEFFVKSTLEEKISYCKKNSQPVDNDFSICIQKAVTDICKLDKIHNGKQSDQHVEKLTSLNIISHCVTVCALLQNDYPAIWQEQDDCRQPYYMCRTVSQTFTSLFPSTKLPHFEPIQTDRGETFFQEQKHIKNDEPDPQSSPQTTEKVINGTICAESCPAKTWYAVEIENTNLILVVVHKLNPTCNCECQSTFGLKTEIKRNLSISIENPIVQKPNYFDQFVTFTKEENSTECSDDSAMSTMPLKWMITLLLLLFFLVLY